MHASERLFGVECDVKTDARRISASISRSAFTISALVVGWSVTSAPSPRGSRATLAS